MNGRDDYGLQPHPDVVAPRAALPRTFTAPQPAPKRTLGQHSTHAELIEHYRSQALGLAEGPDAARKMRDFTRRLEGGGDFFIDGEVVWVMLYGAQHRCRLELVLAMRDGYVTFAQLNRANPGA